MNCESNFRGSGELCRLCMNMEDSMVSIFDGDGLEHDLPTKISKYLPIKIAQSDTISLKVCLQCTSLLISWHNLFENSKVSDAALRSYLCSENKTCSVSVSSQNETSFYENVKYEIEEAKFVDDTGIENVEIDLVVLQDNEQEMKFKGEKSNGAIPNDVKDVTIHDERFLYYWSDEKSWEDRLKTRCVCAYCNEIIANKRYLPNHIDECHVGIPNSNYKFNDKHVFECRDCWISFDTDFQKTNHMVFIHGIRNKEHEFQVWKSEMMKGRFKCRWCGKTLRSERTLIAHETRHQNPNYRAVNCPICGKRIGHEYSLKVHQLKVHKIPRNLLYIKEKSVRQYKERIRIEDGKKMYHCNFCDYFTPVYQRFDRHYTRHTNPEKNYTCDSCGKQFRLRDSIVQHLKLVHNAFGDTATAASKRPKCVAREKKFECDICGKAHSTLAGLENHRRTHTGEKPFVCCVCCKTFTSASAYYMHKRLHDPSTYYRCEICDKTIKLKQAFTKHMNVHKGVRNYVCEVCGAAFFDAAVLNRHKFVHVSETPHVCSVCGSSFKMLRYLKAHELTHVKKRSKKDADKQVESDY